MYHAMLRQRLVSPHTAVRHHAPARSARWRFARNSLRAAAVTVAVGAALANVGQASARARPPMRVGRSKAQCVLIVPNQPLTARGLATPFHLTSNHPLTAPCHQANPTQAAFVQGAVLDPATGAISIYDPLVIDAGTTPAAAPVTPKLPANAVVALWVGFNGTVLRLAGAQASTLSAANCVNGLAGSYFGQYAYCNAPSFFQSATRLISAGKLTVPPLGTGADGQPCPTVRDFSVVDQDQSDNVTTSYLVTGDGRLAQNSAANQATLTGAFIETNASDNRLVAVALDGALGCTPWQAPNLADAGAPAPALPLDELQAAKWQKAPIATVPSGDPMALVAGKPNLTKQNLYRQGVDQAPVASTQQARSDMLAYCQHIRQIAPRRLALDESLTSARSSPDPAVANSLYTFLAQRLDFTYGAQGLSCEQLLHHPSPVTLTKDAHGITIAAKVRS